MRIRSVLSIDQGTTNTKAVLVDREGRVVAHGAAPVPLVTPRPGWAEHRPAELWDSVLTAVTRCLRGEGSPDAVAISAQRESVAAWRRSTGDPLGPVIGWQDARMSTWCRRTGLDGLDTMVRDRTGLRLDPMFSAPKLRWLLDHLGARPGDVCVGTIDSWLIWQLTGGTTHACDAGNAARTLLYDIRTLDWSEELLAAFGIPRAVLPMVERSDAEFGRTQGVPGIQDGTPIIVAMADSHAALYAEGCRQPGTAKATYGTGSSVMAPTPTATSGDAAVATTVAWLRDTPAYALEGNIISSGAALQWMATILGRPSVADLVSLAESVPDSQGVIWVPALAGLGAPHWDRSATALLTGVTQTTSAAHIARAAVDAVAHQICDVVDAIERHQPVAELRADGGATASTVLMQTQADLLGRPVRVARVRELSALGAAWLGLSAHANAPDREAPAAVSYEPTIGDRDRLVRRRSWAEAVVRARTGGGVSATELR